MEALCLLLPVDKRRNLARRHQLGPAITSISSPHMSAPSGSHFTSHMGIRILIAVHADSLPLPEASTVSPLEQLFRLEIEFHRRLRTQAPGTADASSVHTSYALQSRLRPAPPLRRPVPARDVETLRERLTLAGDARNVLAARDSLKQLLGLRLLDPLNPRRPAYCVANYPGFG